jgi:signal transduction histidine kinase
MFRRHEPIPDRSTRKFARGLGRTYTVRMQFFRRIPTLAAAILLLLRVLPAQAPEGAYLDPAAIPVLHDAGENFSFEQVRALDAGDFPMDAGQISGYSRGDYWFYLEPDLFDPTGGFLFEEYGFDRVELYFPVPGAGYRSVISGWSLPASTRAIPNRHTNFAVPAESIADGRPIYLRAGSATSMQTILSFRTSLQLDRFHRSDTWLLGLFYGIALGLLFYQAFFTAVFRNREYLLFLLYFVTSVVVFAYSNGIAGVLLWPDAPWMNHQTLVFIIPVSMLFLMFFVREIFRDQGISPLLNAIIIAFASAVVVLMILMQLIDRQSAYRLNAYMNAVFPVILLAISVYMFARGHKLKWFYLGSFILYISGILLIILRNLGVLPQNFLTNFAFQIGYLAHLLVLGLSLSQKINTLRAEAEHVRNQLEVLNRDLESTVGERTLDLKQTNIDLQRKISELSLTQKRLAESEKHAALGRTVAGLAHEINTPLGNSITAVSYLQSMIRQWEENPAPAADQIPELKEIGDMVSRNLQTASRLVDAFKELATDQYEEEPRDLNIREYLDELALSFAHKFRQKQVNFINDIQDEAHLRTVPGHIARIFTNLFDNSLDHGFPDGPGEREEKRVIRISSLVSPAGTQLTYADNGGGADPDIVRTIFDPFTTTRRSAGYRGLGLSIVWNLVSNSLNGHIECRPGDSSGLAFIITIPRGEES